MTTKVYECPECERRLMIQVRQDSYPNETIYCDCGDFTIMEVVVPDNPNRPTIG